MDFSIFPYWMGISNWEELILAIFCMIILFFLYCLFGYAFCPNSLKVQWIRALFILFWPLIIVFDIVLFPFYMVYEFSKSPEQIEKEWNEFIKESK